MHSGGYSWGSSPLCTTEPALWWHLGLPDLRLERVEDIFLLCDGKESNSIQSVFWCRPLPLEVKKNQKPKNITWQCWQALRGYPKWRWSQLRWGVGTWTPHTSPGPPLLSSDESSFVRSATFFGLRGVSSTAPVRPKSLIWMEMSGSAPAPSCATWWAEATSSQTSGCPQETSLSHENSC